MDSGLNEYLAVSELMKNHPKHLAVLNAVADKIGWGKSKPPEGQFRGIAQHMGYGSYVAAAAEVSGASGVSG